MSVLHSIAPKSSLLAGGDARSSCSGTAGVCGCPGQSTWCLAQILHLAVLSRPLPVIPTPTSWQHLPGNSEAFAVHLGVDGDSGIISEGV